MNEVPYPLKGDRLGRIIHLPFEGNPLDPLCKDKSLTWFFIRSYPNEELHWLYPSSFYEEIKADPCAEGYAVQHFGYDEADETVRAWRQSHAKELFLIRLLRYMVQPYIFIYEQAEIEYALTATFGIDLSGLEMEEADLQEYGDLLRWIKSPVKKDVRVALSKKGFEAIRKYLPPVSSPIYSPTK